jgi:hypothetical protein
MNCECLTQKEKGAKAGICHYEGCPCYNEEYEQTIKAYKMILTSYRVGKNHVPEKAFDILQRNTFEEFSIY